MKPGLDFKANVILLKYFGFRRLVSHKITDEREKLDFFRPKNFTIKTNTLFDENFSQQ